MKYTQADIDELVVLFGRIEKFSVGENRMTGLWFRNNYDSSGRELHRSLTKKWELMERIEECRITGTGLMWVTESGMDCDCTQYAGHLHKCEATVWAYRLLYEEINEYTDGTFSLWPVTEEEREESVPRSRDLAMEAHEDGHPHVVYPRAL